MIQATDESEALILILPKKGIPAHIGIVVRLLGAIRVCVGGPEVVKAVLEASDGKEADPRTVQIFIPDSSRH